MKKQVILIRGGDIFETYKEYFSFIKKYEFKKNRLLRNDWRDELGSELGKNFEVYLPDMVNARNARYSEWKIWFEKVLSVTDKEIILIGSSLGGLFLVKYLSENIIPKKILKLILVAAPFGDKSRTQKYYLADFYFKSKNFVKLEKQCRSIDLYHSIDDSNVPYSDLNKYKKYLKNANFHEFKNRDHFGQEKFPELVKNIKSI